MRVTAIGVGVVALTLSACTYQRGYLSYDDRGGDVQLRADAWQGERLGVVRASEGGAVWKDCTEVAEASIWVLMEEARKLGGNAIGDFRWVPQHPGHSSEVPTCRQRWGWFLIWPAVLSPAFQSAGVEAVAYRVADASVQRTGVFHIPDAAVERMELARAIARGD